MNNYSVKYFNGSSGVKTVQATSSADAKLKVETSGAPGVTTIVWDIQGPEGRIAIMDYAQAVKMVNG